MPYIDPVRLTWALCAPATPHSCTKEVMAVFAHVSATPHSPTWQSMLNL